MLNYGNFKQVSMLALVGACPEKNTFGEAAQVYRKNLNGVKAATNSSSRATFTNPTSSRIVARSCIRKIAREFDRL